MTLTSTGSFLIPASMPGTMVVDFIQAHKDKAFSILREIRGLVFVCVRACVFHLVSVHVLVCARTCLCYDSVR
jgi:hypothetical protein